MKSIFSVVVTALSIVYTCALATPAVDQADAEARAKQEWHEKMRHVPLPPHAENETGCFEAQYPETEIRQVPCGDPDSVPPFSRPHPPPTKVKKPRSNINEKASSPQTPTAPIRSGASAGTGLSVGEGWMSGLNLGLGNFSSAWGYFPQYTGTLTGDYSIQMNSNYWTYSRACNSSPQKDSCEAWQQFIYSKKIGLLFQYWLVNFSATDKCPTGWKFNSGSCYKTSDPYSIPTLANNQIQTVQFIVFAADGGSTLALQFEDDIGVYYLTAVDYLGLGVPDRNLIGTPEGWKTTEFNIFGDGNGSAATFSGAADIYPEVTGGLFNGALSTVCVYGSGSAETNNLQLGWCESTFSGGSQGIKYYEYKTK